MPDIDCDFDYERRGEVIDYVRRRYGADHVAQIITFGTMAARAVLRDVGRVLDMSYQQVDQIAKMVPFELNITLERAMKVNPELRRAYEGDGAVRRLIDMARKLEGMPRNASTHAAGVLITAEPVVEYCPLQTNDDVITTQFPMTHRRAARSAEDGLPRTAHAQRHHGHHRHGACRRRRRARCGGHSR